MLLGHLQENLITLLTFDDKRALTIRSLVEINLWGGHYKLICIRIYDYIDQFKKAPKDHLPDLLMDKLDGENKREAELYIETIEAIGQLREGINSEYVMSQLETYIKRQSYRSIGIEFAKLLQKDTDESLEEAEALLAKANVKTLSVFDPGIRLSDPRALDFLDIQDSCLPTGIPELDKRGFGPTRKELWHYISDTKKGKSMMLVQLGKMASIHKFKVCHISLEMSKERCAQRYYSSFFGMSKRKQTFINTKFQKDKLGRVTGFEETRVVPSLSLDDPNIRAKLERRIAKAAPRTLNNIIVKDFPTGYLTMRQLETYLDNLEQTEQFTPDLLIIDYPRLMKLDPANLRLELDQAFNEIRGIAVKRNLAAAVVSQSNREGSKAKQLGADKVGEAYSTVANSDTNITYTQSPQEKKLNLARLFVAAGRNDEDRITIILSQQYGHGAFVLDSCLMIGQYFENLPKDGFGEDD